MNKAAKVITAMGVTAAIGAILGVLYAPAKGKRTRRKLEREYNKLACAIDNKLNDSRDKVEDLKDNIEDQLDMLQEKILQLRKCRK